jgi:hypothetical protein
MNQQPVIRTPISMRDFARALIRTLRSSGTTPTKEACGVFWAQYALETGAGGFCWNHNLFNHKVTKAMADSGTPFMMLANTWEIERGKKVTYQPPHQATWFRAYASFEAAMSHHVTAIQKGRYASSWPAVLAGDPELYAAKIRERGYYTAPLASYVALMRAKYDPWMRSTAYDEALAEEDAASEAETVPDLELEAYRAEPPAAIVRPRVPLGLPSEDPDDAA